MIIHSESWIVQEGSSSWVLHTAAQVLQTGPLLEPVCWQYFRQANQGTLEVLQHKFEVLARLRQDFHTTTRDRDQRQRPAIQIMCFFEELPVRNIRLVCL